jgi:hypothetical protein
LTGKPSLVKLAKSITDKWFRVIYSIKDTYNDNFDSQYRDMQKKLDKIRESNAPDEEEEL